MDMLKDIFNEYTRMRANGLDAKTSLHALRPYVEPLTREEKDALAAQLRQWESNEGQRMGQTVEKEFKSPPSAPPRKSAVIKPLKPSSPPPAAAADEQSSKVFCTQCGKENPPGSLFCASCGNMLVETQGQFQTRQFNETDALLNESYFSPDSTLFLELRETGHYFELRPQDYEHELIAGRSTANSAMVPDIDLEDFDGANLGVSRLHLSFQYHKADNAIQVVDLGSANGSFINGQKLHPKEVRILRHGDELRLGRLVMRAYYRHDAGS